MPRYVFQNATRSRIYLPGAGWIGPQGNLEVDTQAVLLDNSTINTLLQKGTIRMLDTVESPGINNHIEVPVVDITGATGSDPNIYPPSATNPTVPPPNDGDLYYNTVIDEMMYYDASRSKWLSIAERTVESGRNGATGVGAFYRGTNGMVLNATTRGIPVPQGTLVSISWSRTDADAATLEVLVNGGVIATLASSTSGPVTDESVDADHAAGNMSFRNQAGGNITSNVQIVAVTRQRI